MYVFISRAGEEFRSSGLDAHRLKCVHNPASFSGRKDTDPLERPREDALLAGVTEPGDPQVAELLQKRADCVRAADRDDLDAFRGERPRRAASVSRATRSLVPSTRTTECGFDICIAPFSPRSAPSAKKL
jgi:hypothetical protein